MVIEIRQVQSVSPSYAEVLRTCLLKVGFARAHNTGKFILGNPKLWLGTAYHEVLRQVVDIKRSSIPSQEEIGKLWMRAVEALYRRNLNHPLDHRFGPPERWPGYYLVYSSLLIRIKDLLSSYLHQGVNPVATPGANISGAIREHEFVALDGKLKGRPDLVISDKIIDYKSGDIFEDSLEGQSNYVKAAYIRQLRVYAFLVKETFGYWPRCGVILPVAGPGVVVSLDSMECEQEAYEVVSLLDHYNGVLNSSVDPSSLASPGPQICRWCSYRLICPAFWQKINPDWAELLGEITLDGELSNHR